jgi:hypothetical protein
MPNYDEKSDDPAEKPKGFDTNHSTTVESPPHRGGGVAGEPKTPRSPGSPRSLGSLISLGDTKNKNKYAHYIIICIIQCQKHTCSAERPNALQIR